MGQTLSEPVTTKESSYCRNSQFRPVPEEYRHMTLSLVKFRSCRRWDRGCMQGWRIHMEDSHTHILSLPDDPEAAFFAVYDGHGGSNVAEYAGKHLHKYIVKQPSYKTNIAEALKQSFLDLDDAMRVDETMQEQMAGSTAITCLIKNNRLYCANAGDSRMIACVNGKVEVLSDDHKPNNEKEHKRICEAGGFVECNRVNGNLALSRALGDFMFKRNSNKIPEEQIVTAYPDVFERDLTEDWEFAILACDGIWDVLRNETVTQFCRHRIANGMDPEQICEELMERCLAPDAQMGGLGGDNMTVVLICFLHGKSYEDLVQKCASDKVIDDPSNKLELEKKLDDDSTSECSSPEPEPDLK